MICALGKFLRTSAHRLRRRPARARARCRCTMTSQPALSSASTRSSRSGPTPTARADAQPAALVFRRVRVLLGLLDVLDRDQTLAACRRRRRPAASRCGSCAAAPWLPPASCLRATVMSCLVIIALTGWSRFRSKRMSRLVRMPTGRPSAATTGSREMSWRRISSSGGGQLLIGPDGDRVDDDAGLRLLDLRRPPAPGRDAQVLVQDADAALARHRNRRRRLGDGVHRRRHDRDREPDARRQLRSHLDVLGDDVTFSRDQQDVVERQRFPKMSVRQHLGTLADQAARALAPTDERREDMRPGSTGGGPAGEAVAGAAHGDEVARVLGSASSLRGAGRRSCRRCAPGRPALAPDHAQQLLRARTPGARCGRRTPAARTRGGSA